MLNTSYKGTHSWLLEYISKCKLGEIIVGHELMMEFDRILKDFNDPSIKVELEDAHKRIKFIETKCKHSEALCREAFFVGVISESIYRINLYIQNIR